jgi:hypothetical protein
MKRWAKSRRLRVQKGDSLPFEVRKIKLLVDGDHFGCSQIRDAVAFLAEKSTHLHTLIYAAPGRINNKKMRVLLQQPDISFVPVPRSKNHAAEPNDDAIIAEMLESAKSPSSECIALLTNDKGFASAIKDVISQKRQFFVFVSNRSTSVVNFYRKQGIPLLGMPSKIRHSQMIDALLPEGRFTKIRAILRSDGQGTVEFGEAFDSVAKRSHAEGVYDSFESLLKDQTCTASFSSSGAYPIQRISKFWFTNGLGSLTIFPLPFAVLSLDHAIRQESRKWISKTQDLAFFFPSRSGRVSKSNIKTFGSKLVWSIFRGGGPFMLWDSKDLVAKSLRKLGYLDDSWNTDFTEALTCFRNAAANKVQLRKLGCA